MVAKKINEKWEKVNHSVERRMNLLTDIIEGIKSIKYLGWENIFIEKVQEIRKLEFNYISVAKYLDACCVLFWASTSIVIASSTFYFYSFLGYKIEETNVFSVKLESILVLTNARILHYFKCSCFL